MPHDPFAAYVAQADPFAAFVAQETAPPDAATAGMPEMSTRETLPAGVEVMGGPLMPPLGQLAGVPGVISNASGKLWRGAQALTKAMSTPTGAAVIGAAEGGRRGGVEGAITGAVTGYGGGKLLPAVLGKAMGGSDGKRMADGMSQAGQSSRAATGGKAPLIDALMRGDSADDLIGMARTMRGTPPAAAPKPSALFDEVLARQPIDWRTTDAVPIDAMTRALGRKGGSIIEAGESIPGLAERMAVALKAGDATLAETLARAIRQRMHITTKVRGQ